jgi:hypothetical protein
MSHYTDKTYFFRDDQDNRLVVVTSLLPNGDYEAIVLDNNNCDDHRSGIGATRMEAIVDLREQLEENQ